MKTVMFLFCVCLIAGCRAAPLSETRSTTFLDDSLPPVRDCSLAALRRVAGNAEADPHDRANAVVNIFGRYVRPGMNAEAVANLLPQHRAWLREEDIRDHGRILGWLPLSTILEANDDDPYEMISSLLLFSRQTKPKTQEIFIVLSNPKHIRWDLFGFLCGNSLAGDPKIMEFTISGRTGFLNFTKSGVRIHEGSSQKVINVLPANQIVVTNNLETFPIG
jgi:hypothetical protein